MVTGFLLPLWVVLTMLGTSLGISPEQAQDKNVYVSMDEGRWTTGIACDWQLFPDGGAGWFADHCGDLPARTVVIYWRNVDPTVYGDDYRRYVLRHEVEHLLRGRDGPPGDINNESAARAAGCAVAPGWWCGW